ncbi:MAG: hypothetical protein PWP48_1838 [Clostridiales bacterium]|nr:hypothetical protein [Clostridiales bacterium]
MAAPAVLGGRPFCARQNGVKNVIIYCVLKFRSVLIMPVVNNRILNSDRSSIGSDWRFSSRMNAINEITAMLNVIMPVKDVQPH